jgi:hypothetical protein
MKYFGFVLALVPGFFSFGQISYEFGQPVPPQAETVTAVASSLYGDYKNEETGTIYHLDANGISMVSVIYSFITREQLRESTRYAVRDNYIFGVVAGDSLPCVLEGERYFFGIRQQATVVGNGSEHVLLKINESSYMLNFRESEGYSPSMLTFSNGSLAVRHFDYPSGTNVFEGIGNQQNKPTSTLKTKLITPLPAEWQQLDKSVIFGAGIVYQRQIK